MDITPDQIATGDFVRIVQTERGIRHIREGQVASMERTGKNGPRAWLNAEGGILLREPVDKDTVIELLDRELPDEPEVSLGAVAEMLAADGETMRYFIHVGDGAWIEKGLPHYAYAWAEIPAAQVISQGWWAEVSMAAEATK